MDENFAKLFKTPRQKYTEGVLNHLLIKEEDLTETEKEIITYGFDLLRERLDEMKILNDEIKRLKENTKIDTPQDLNMLLQKVK